tara:strand:- start:229 stop:420 length:192 start_codon:yes stop_codon:yes gene_type:complete
MFAVALVAALWSWDNQEFIKTSNAQLAEGLSWNKIECRTPIEGLPNIVIKGPNGKEYVCWKMK